MAERAALTPASERSVAALRRALLRSNGAFSFHVVICSGLARSEVIERPKGWSTTGEVPSLQFIPVGRAGLDLLQSMLAEIARP